MANHQTGTFDPILQRVLSQRLLGQGADLSPQFETLGSSLRERSRASEGAQRRQTLEDALTRGTGRSGATGAALRGVSATAAGQRRGIEAGLGLEEQKARQQAIQQAIMAALQGSGIQSSERLGMRGLDIDQQRVDLQRQQVERMLEDPGILEIFGEVLGLGAETFGAQGAFSKVFGA